MRHGVNLLFTTFPNIPLTLYNEKVIGKTLAMLEGMCLYGDRFRASRPGPLPGFPGSYFGEDFIMAVTKSATVATVATVRPTGVVGPLTGLFKVAPGVLKLEDGYNFRHFSPAVFPLHAELQASIVARGVETPLVVRFGNPDHEEDATCLYVVQGHMRLGAVLARNAMAGVTPLEYVPCRMAPAGQTDEERTLDLMVSNQFIPVTQLELGIAALRMRSFGRTMAYVAEQRGVTSRAVEETIRLAKADKKIVALVRGYINRQGVAVRISDTLALQTMTVAGADAPAVMEAAAELAPTEGTKMGRVTAPIVAAAIAQIEAKTGKPIVGASGAVSVNAKAAGAAAAASGAALTAKAGRTAAIATTKAKAAAPAPADTGLLTAKRGAAVGPFKAGSGATILDSTGDGVAVCSDDVTCKVLVSYLNQGYYVDQSARIAALTASNARPGTTTAVKAAAVKAAAVKAPAPAAPEAPVVALDALLCPVPAPGTAAVQPSA